MAHTAHIVEIFSSPQGEGIYTGQQMTFVRFQNCSLGCKYCDTTQALCEHKNFRVETPPRSRKFALESNPVSPERLSNILNFFDDTFLSVTGGEPLEQPDFLAEWLPLEFSKRRILLETNGVHADELSLVLPFVHVVSMDFKLPSSTGCVPLWRAHHDFLKNAVASGKEVYVKIVLTKMTSDVDIEDAIKIITSVNKFIPTIIQPASRTLTFKEKTSKDRLDSAKRLLSAYLEDVRIMPQMHKEWGVM